MGPRTMHLQCRTMPWPCSGLSVIVFVVSPTMFQMVTAMTEEIETLEEQPTDLKEDLSDEALDRPGLEYKFLCSSGPSHISPRHGQ